MLSYSKISNKLEVILLVENSIKWKLEAFNFRYYVLCVYLISSIQYYNLVVAKQKYFPFPQLNSAQLSVMLQRILVVPHEMSEGGS